MIIHINHFTDLFNFLNSVGLLDIPPFDNFGKTVRRYVDLCGCDRVAEKNQAGEAAKRLYSALIRNDLAQHIHMIKNKKKASAINLYEDGKLVVRY